MRFNQGIVNSSSMAVCQNADKIHLTPESYSDRTTSTSSIVNNKFILNDAGCVATPVNNSSIISRQYQHHFHDPGNQLLAISRKHGNGGLMTVKQYKTSDTFHLLPHSDEIIIPNVPIGFHLPINEIKRQKNKLRSQLNREKKKEQ
ncbi:hypothetical protein SK128_014117, partial [Halocaridina rubra]